MSQCRFGGNPSIQLFENELKDCKMFTFGERFGMSFSFEGAILSLLSVSFILLLAAYRRIKHTIMRIRRGKEGQRDSDACDSSLFLALMVADFVHGLGFLADARWIAEARVTEGRLCTTQGVLKQLGLMAIAMTALAIAIHTFAVLSLGWREPKTGKLTLANALIVASLLLTILITTIPLYRYQEGIKVYGKVGYWCWIIPNPVRLFGAYLWMWLSAGLLIILYTANVVSMRSGFVFFKKKQSTSETEDDRRIIAIANSLLFYPAVYLLNIVPLSVVRWITFNGGKPPYQATLFANTLFSLSGVFNLFLFISTRPNVVFPPSAPEVHELQQPQHSEDENDRKSMHSGMLSDGGPPPLRMRHIASGGLPPRRSYAMEEGTPVDEQGYIPWSAGALYEQHSDGDFRNAGTARTASSS